MVAAFSSDRSSVISFAPHETFSKRYEHFVRSEAVKLADACVDAADLVERIVALRDSAKEFGADFDAHGPIYWLARDRVDLALDLADEIVGRGDPDLGRVVGFLAAAGARINAARASKLVGRVFAEGDAEARLSLALPFSDLQVWDAVPKLASRVLKRLLSSEDASVVVNTLHRIAHLRAIPSATKLRLTLGVPLGSDARLADEFSSVFNARGDLSVAKLKPTERAKVLSALESAPDLSSYWTESLLAQFVAIDPLPVVDLFLARLRRRRSAGYRPVPVSGFDKEMKQAFADGKGTPHLKSVWAFAQRYPTRLGWVRVVFWMVAADLAGGLDFIAAKARRVGAPGLRTIAGLLEHGPEMSVLSRPELVAQLLDRAYAEGEELGGRMEFALSTCASPRTITAKMGEPAPAHVRARDGARVAMSRLSAGSRAWRFFKSVEWSSERDIREHLLESEEMGV